jgi:hypothetical protein
VVPPFISVSFNPQPHCLYEAMSESVRLYGCISINGAGCEPFIRTLSINHPALWLLLSALSEIALYLL